MIYNGAQGGVTDAEISGNRIYDESACGICIMNAVNLDIHHNDISQTSDSGLLTFRNFTGLHIRDNVFSDDSINLRVQSEGTVQIQEAYVYRNTFHQPKQPGGRHIFFGNADSTAEPTRNHKWYWYHNSFLGSLAESIGTQNIHYAGHYFLNNVFSMTQLFFWSQGSDNPSLALFDYNWVGGDIGTVYTVPPRATGIPIGTHTLLAPGQQLWDWTTPTSFVLPTGLRSTERGD